MLKYSTNTDNVRIFNRNRLESIDNLSILINKQYFDCMLIDINPKYIYFSIENIGLIQPIQNKMYEYIITADNLIIDKGYINII